MQRPTFFSWVVLCALSVGGTAFAQLSLPSRNPNRPRGDIAPYVMCRACGARNYAASRDGRKDAEGFDLAWCMQCKRDTAHVPPQPARPLPQRTSAQNSGLALPSPNRVVWIAQEVDGRRRWIALPAGSIPRSATASDPKPKARGAPDAAAPAPQANAPAIAAAPAAEPQAEPSPQAAPILDRLAQQRDPRAAAIAAASAELLALGPEGLAACRAALDRTEASVVVAAGRTLLRGGDPADLERVKRRLAGRVPSAAGSLLLDDLVAIDPVAVTPRLLSELLDAPQSSVRQAAQRQLRAAVSPELCGVLAPALASKRSDTRALALELVAEVQDPASLDLLFTHLADPTAKVATIAIRELAARDDASIAPRLIGIAFRQRWILRESAFAVIAIVEREDRTLTPILDDVHAESLLEGLSSTNPFVAGSCAAALAGIGFRSEQPARTEWLDRTVIDRLVATVSGKQYHDDFTALQVTALRRLQLVSGQTIESDGPRWVEWWLGARERFFARRAFIAVPDGAERRFAVRLTTSALDDVALVAEDAAADRLAEEARTVLFVTDAEAKDLIGVLRTEGALGLERLPGTRGATGATGRTLAFSIDGRGKTFTFGGATRESWFDRLTDAVKAVADRNRWQRYAPAGTDRRGYWRSESVWWAAPRSELERAQHMKAAVLASVAGRTIGETALEELERLPPGALVEGDFPRLVAFVRSEPAYSERVRRLDTLAARAAGADERLEGGLSAVHAKTLIDALASVFGSAASDDVARVARAAGPDFTRGLARDPSPILRTAAARALGAAEGDAAVLLALLDDPDALVEAAAATSLGAHRVEAARTELIVRARLGAPIVRAAALEAVARLGGEFVLDALAVGAADPDPTIQAAAARGLAEISGGGSVPLLVALLGQSNESVAEAARTGLLRAGEAAWPDLLSVLHAPAHRARRAVALILAHQGVADAASVLMTILSGDPKDAFVASELAVLTGVDCRGRTDPASAWWEWWDGVVHDDALAWFLAALARPSEGQPTVRLPARDAFDGEGTLAARLALVDAMDRPEAYLAERARRELARRLGRELASLPARGPSRDVWLADLRRTISTPSGQ